MEEYKYSEEYSKEIYFLEEQKRIVPEYDLSLKEQLEKQAEYWILNGPGTCGKTAIAKYIASEFGFKLIEFEVEAGVAR
jgi:replication-associated recombination protein RarA